MKFSFYFISWTKVFINEKNIFFEISFLFLWVFFLKQGLIHDFIGIRMINCIQQNPDPQHCNKYVQKFHSGLQLVE